MLVLSLVVLVLTGVFLFASTTARTSNALLGWNCGYTFTSNVMYGVLYAVSPELFPTKDRGTGNAIVSSANRVFGIMVRLVPLIQEIQSLIYLLNRPLLLHCMLTFLRLSLSM